MPRFGKTSKRRLATCHEDLQEILNEVIKYFDCSVLCGHRGEADQNKAYESGHSKVKWPNGRHNKKPSIAVDILCRYGYGHCQSKRHWTQMGW